MSDKIPVQNEKTLLRDTKTGALLSTDTSGAAQYKRRIQEEHDKNNELNTLKQELSDIKNLLKKLIGENYGG